MHCNYHCPLSFKLFRFLTLKSKYAQWETQCCTNLFDPDLLMATVRGLWKATDLSKNVFVAIWFLSLNDKGWLYLKRKASKTLSFFSPWKFPLASRPFQHLLSMLSFCSCSLSLLPLYSNLWSKIPGRDWTAMCQHHGQQHATGGI